MLDAISKIDYRSDEMDDAVKRPIPYCDETTTEGSTESTTGSGASGSTPGEHICTSKDQHVKTNSKDQLPLNIL